MTTGVRPEQFKNALCRLSSTYNRSAKSSKMKYLQTAYIFTNFKTKNWHQNLQKFTKIKSFLLLKSWSPLSSSQHLFWSIFLPIRAIHHWPSLILLFVFSQTISPPVASSWHATRRIYVHQLAADHIKPNSIYDFYVKTNFIHYIQKLLSSSICPFRKVNLVSGHFTTLK